MARIRDPALFTKQFGVDPEKLTELGVFDPLLNADTKMFIDPLLLRHSEHPTIRKDAVADFEDFFGRVIKLLQGSQQIDDVAWRTADRLLKFKEPNVTCLGYSAHTTHGSAIGKKLRRNLMITAKEIIELGIKDPEFFALLGLLEDNIGADRISDLTTHATLKALLKFNEEILEELDVPTEEFLYRGQKIQLVRNPFEETRTPVVLVPKDVLRELPIAHDWGDVADAASQNQELRDRVNAQIGDIWAAKTRKEKAKLRKAALATRKAFETLLDAVGACDKSPYDPQKDPEGHYLWRQVLTEIAKQFPIQIVAPKQETVGELERVVDEIVVAFTELIENKGQWYHLWQNGEPRHERAAQRLFFAVADVYCKANNLDVTPEADSGGGPVDFKFSSGYGARVLVEIKLSTGRVVHGYNVQLEVYKKAENTDRGKFLVIDVGKMGKKLETITKARNAAIGRGERASQIIVVDGTKKASASKR